MLARYYSVHDIKFNCFGHLCGYMYREKRERLIGLSVLEIATARKHSEKTNARFGEIRQRQ